MRKPILTLAVAFFAVLAAGCDGGSGDTASSLAAESATVPTAAPTATTVAATTVAATATPLPLLPQDPIAGSLDIEVTGVGFIDTLTEAIGWATDGQPIVLPPRNIELTEPLTIISTTVLQGDPSGESFITAAPGEAYAIAVLGEGSLTMSRVVLDPSESEVGILVGGSGDAVLSFCHIDAALGSALLARDEASLSVDACEFGRSVVGVEVTDQASADIRDSLALDNSVGFKLSSRGELTLTGNAASTSVVGFEMNGSSPTLQGNEANLSETDGFQWRGTSAGTATGNTATVNGGAGFRVLEVASPDLSGNTASENEVGFSWQDSASGDVSGNDATLNSTVGFTLRDGALPVLTGNTAADNVEHGFFLFGSFSLAAKRALTDNVATGNGGAGFALAASRPDAVLVGNQATDNADAGFFFGASAGGDATGNTASGNRVDWLNNAPRFTASANFCADGSC